MKRLLHAFTFFALATLALPVLVMAADHDTKGQMQELCFGGSALLPTAWSVEDCGITRATENTFKERTKTTFLYEKNQQTLARVNMMCLQTHYSNMLRMKNDIVNKDGGRSWVDSFIRTNKDVYQIKEFSYESFYKNDVLSLTTIYNMLSLHYQLNQSDNIFYRDFFLFYPFQLCVISGECALTDRQRFEPVFNEIFKSFAPQPILDYVAFKPQKDDIMLRLCNGAQILIPAGWEISSDKRYDTNPGVKDKICPKLYHMAYYKRNVEQSAITILEFSQSQEEYAALYNKIVTDPLAVQHGFIKQLLALDMIGANYREIDSGYTATNKTQHFVWARLIDIEHDASASQTINMFRYCAEFYTDSKRFLIIANCMEEDQNYFAPVFANIIKSFSVL